MSLKRPSPLSYDMCIICQERRTDETHHSTVVGLGKLKSTVETRKKLRDVLNRDSIDRIETAFAKHDVSELVKLITWHRKCYSLFTHKGKIERLEKSHNMQDALSVQMPSTNSLADISSLRSHSAPVDWSQCIFCQCVKTKGRLSAVTQANVSSDIMRASQYDHTMRIRLAGVTDLMAADAMYHNNCRTRFERNTSKAQAGTSNDADYGMLWICEELQYAADKGQVIALTEVWDRYCVLACDAGSCIPQQFYTRMTSFKNKLQDEIGNIYQFVQTQNSSTCTKQTLLVPVKYGSTTVSDMLEKRLDDDDDDYLTMPSYAPHDDIFLSLVHVALKLRNDLLHQEGHTGMSVSEEDAVKCIPESVYMFLQLLYGGDQRLDDDEYNNGVPEMNILSMGQDMVYGLSKGSKLTPKHIGLGCSLHQATRSKKLVELFHRAGHTISYHQILQIDTALAESTLESMDKQSGAVIPANISAGKFVHFTADNIDINDGTLDGKNTFHATQMAAWQRETTSNSILGSLGPSKRKTLDVPDIMNLLSPVEISTPRNEPVFPSSIQTCFETRDTSEAVKARSVDTAFLIRHYQQDKEDRTTWTSFNKAYTCDNHEVTSIGFMPIIQAPAHEYATLNTVVHRCMYVSSQLGQTHTVITTDQALYCKLMELKWATPAFNTVIMRLGGLHTAMAFLSTIGQYVDSSGLTDVWTESGLLGPLTAEKVLTGKAYAKGMRAHKLSLQALWRVLMQTHLSEYLQRHDAVLQHIPTSDIHMLIEHATTETFQKVMADFGEELTEQNVNYSYWWKYMEMVFILLMFTRAQREGNWELHMYSFKRMLPFFFQYNHTNYARWGTVYIAEMANLPEEVASEFHAGNFVIKGSTGAFNQVDPDQGQEWMNATGKTSGGIVGITKTPSALSRWTLSYNLRSQISESTNRMFQIKHYSEHNECLPGRVKTDCDAEEKLVETLKKFGVFSDNNNESLQAIYTKDIATSQIENSLLTVETHGRDQLQSFVESRLLPTDDPDKHTPFYDPIKRNNVSTFKTLYELHKTSINKEKQSHMKMDRSILQRLVTAYEAGRHVDITQILKHELLPVPLSLAQMNGTLRTGNKSILVDTLTDGITVPESITPVGTSTLVIDGQALVMVIGSTPGMKIFGDFADKFCNIVFSLGKLHGRIDVVFDRYRSNSIKEGTRTKRAGTTRPIRRVVEGRDVCLPAKWGNFIALGDNKADLARFLSNELIRNSPENKTVVVAGGFVSECEVQCNVSLDTTNLESSHEEADTRLILHAIHCKTDTVVILSRDTDVLLLLLAHIDKIGSSTVWMMSGTLKKPKLLPVTTIAETLSFELAASLLAFHALTGSDTTSYIAGHTKKTAWHIFKYHYALLENLGTGDLSEATLSSVEAFICKLYKVDTESIDQARCILFAKYNAPEQLPPTRDALTLHVKRAHYQTLVWKQAHIAKPVLPSPETLGWRKSDGVLLPELMSLNPVPDMCLEMITCQCASGCNTLRCKCRKSKLLCTTACGCHQKAGSRCVNVPAD